MLPEVADALGLDGPDVEYALNTMNGLRTHHGGKKISNLKIKGATEIQWHDLPSIVTSSYIPDCKGEAATPEIVEKIPSVKNFAKLFSK